MRGGRSTAIGCRYCTKQFTVSHNRILNNHSGVTVNLVGGQSKVYQNLIAYNAGVAIRVYQSGVIEQGHQIISNTITHNAVTETFMECGGVGARATICLGGNGLPAPTIRGNNIYENQAPYDVVMGTGPEQIGDVTGIGNYWGTTNRDTIQARIYDFYQDFQAGVFEFVPFLTAPGLDAPTLPTVYLPLVLRN
jgi:hypothetical protein